MAKGSFERSVWNNQQALLAPSYKQQQIVVNI